MLGSLIVTRVFDDALARAERKIQAAMACITLLESLDDPQRMEIVVEAKAMAAQTLVERPLASMPERRMTDIVDQRQSFRQINVQAKRGRNLARNLCDFDGVGEPTAEVVGRAAGEDLRLARESAERARLHYPVAVTLEGAATITYGRRKRARGQGQFLVAEDRAEPQRFWFGTVFDHCWQCSATQNTAVAWWAVVPGVGVL